MLKDCQKLTPSANQTFREGGETESNLPLVAGNDGVKKKNEGGKTPRVNETSGFRSARVNQTFCRIAIFR